MTPSCHLFDVHCHLTSEQYPMEDREPIFHEALRAGVTKLMVVATDDRALQEALELQDFFGKDTIKIAAATPPHDIINEENRLLAQIQKLALEKKLSAIGETGLEYFYCPETKMFQQKALHQYLECALAYNLPVVIHCREAFHDFLPLVESFFKERGAIRGMIHCFTGTREEAKRCLDLGWSLSFSGIVTFPKSKQIQEIASYMPLDRLLIETDAPYLAPKQKRGQQNRPAYLVYTAEFLASLRGMEYEAFAEATFENAATLFSE